MNLRPGPILTEHHTSPSPPRADRVPSYSRRNPNGSVIQLLNVDCAEGLRELPDGAIDCIVTSPPYNLGIAYGHYDDRLPRADYLAWLETICTGLKQKLSADGSFFLNVGAAPSNPWGPFEIITMLRPHFTLQNVIHWVKSIYVENETDHGKQAMNVGHYKPINSNRFLNDTQEFVFHLTKAGDVPIDRLAIGVPYKDQANATRWKSGGAGVRCRGNSWYIPYKTINSRDLERPHPASFPMELAEMCIRLHGTSGGRPTVLDPFMGIGNTAMACARIGTDCIGFEIDREYYETSCAVMERRSELTIRLE